MYANGFDAPKDNCLNGGIWIFLGFEFESLFSIWKFLVFIFSEKKITKVLKKRTAAQAYFSAYG